MAKKRNVMARRVRRRASPANVAAAATPPSAHPQAHRRGDRRGVGPGRQGNVLRAKLSLRVPEAMRREIAIRAVLENLTQERWVAHALVSKRARAAALALTPASSRPGLRHIHRKRPARSLQAEILDATGDGSPTDERRVHFTVWVSLALRLELRHLAKQVAHVTLREFVTGVLQWYMVLHPRREVGASAGIGEREAQDAWDSLDEEGGESDQRESAP